MRRRAILLVVAMGAAVIVGSGVALAANINCGANPCLGTSDPDLIQGNDNFNEVYAAAGNDIVFSFGGGDLVFGDTGNDVVYGDTGQDVINGGPDGDGSAQGTDFGDPDIANLEGGQDSDVVKGGAGNDYIDAAYRDEPSEFPNTEPVDYSYGGGGNDRIYAVDGNEDIIDCGKGTSDRAFIDKGIDTNDIRGCERITELP